MGSLRFECKSVETLLLDEDLDSSMHGSLDRTRLGGKPAVAVAESGSHRKDSSAKGRALQVKQGRNVLKSQLQSRHLLCTRVARFVCSAT